MHRHVLCVMPHPDDETLSSGGTLATYASQGIPVTYACGTLGQLGRNMGKPLFANRETLPVLREQELREACRILGVNLRLMGLRDKTLEFMNPDVLTAQVTALIDELKPTLLVTYHPLYGVHPDHCALGAAVVRAVAAMPPEARPPIHTRAFGSGLSELGEPDVLMDIRPVLDVKMAAIRAHRSQTQAMLAEMDKRLAEDPAAKEQAEAQRTREPFWIYKID
jgi:bacillithiol biosynthesis deacetylase BshB2